MSESLEMNDKHIRNTPHSELLHHLSLLVALGTEECVLLTQSLLTCVQTEIFLVKIILNKIFLVEIILVEIILETTMNDSVPETFLQ